MNLDGEFSAPLCYKTCLIGDHIVDGYDYANSYVGTDGLKQHYSCNLTHKSFDRPAPALFFLCFGPSADGGWVTLLSIPSHTSAFFL